MKSKRLQTGLTGSDWFCGAGGSSEGAVAAGLEMVAAANHWKLAIETHNTNHPNVIHYLTNLSQADPRCFPRTNFLLASPECTNHSLAKGKQRRAQGQMSYLDPAKLDPAEERSRATMWCVPRFAEYHDYDVIVVENVVDVRYWRLWDAWIQAMRLLDYDYQTCYFNSMFFNPVNGLHDYAPQSRDRIYVVFWKKGNRRPNLDFRPWAWCSRCETNIQAVQSWKSETRWGRYKRQYIYRCPICAEAVDPYYFAAWNMVDWSIPAPRIGERKRPLKPNTMRRIQIGLEKYGSQSLMIPLDYTHADNKHGLPLSRPTPTQTGRQTLAFVVRMKGDAESSGKSLGEPLPTLTSVGAPFLVELHKTSTAHAITEPLNCVLAGGIHHGLVMPRLGGFITSYYNGSDVVHGVNEPIGTVSTTDRHALVTMPFGELRTMPFVASQYNRKSGAAVAAVNEAMPTVPAMAVHYLAQPDNHQPLSVEDCGFRMFQPHEIKDAMGFRPDYVLLGKSREQIKLAGNAVTPCVEEWLVQQCLETFQ